MLILKEARYKKNTQYDSIHIKFSAHKTKFIIFGDKQINGKLYKKAKK